FRKKLKQKEEGTVQRHFGAAAKAIEAERAKAHPEEHAGSETAAPGAAARANGPAAGAPVRMNWSSPGNEGEKVDKLYQALVSAKEQAGEDTAKLSREGFNEFVKKKTRDLQAQKNCKDVEYVVEVVDGQVKLKALVKS